MGKVGIPTFPFRFQLHQHMTMSVPSVLRIITLVLASSAMVCGILVVGDILAPPNIPDQFRIILGVVVFLYGAYRFVITFYQKQKS